MERHEAGLAASTESGMAIFPPAVQRQFLLRPLTREGFDRRRKVAEVRNGQ